MHNFLVTFAMGVAESMRADVATQGSIKEFEAMIHGPQSAPVARMPKEFSADDEFRAHVLGIRLTDLD